ncbi:SVP1-like protein 2 [Pseudohyphozyma bogoriensis]|nr:SVP1-like protein 2 [Pseudohyphozyma bogoriensis]
MLPESRRLNLPTHQISDAPPSPILSIQFSSQQDSLFATATTEGWVVYQLNPLRVISRREFPNSSLKFVLPLARSNLLFLVGGPPSPLYPPNKVLFWDDKLGRTVAELEFREDVRGIAARRDRLVVVLRRRVLIFVLGKGGMGVWREGVYETTDNPSGLVALATEEGSTLLAFPGRQPGQVQLVRLPPLDLNAPPLPPPPSHDPSTTPFPSVSIILAHTTSLSALATTPSGALIATASSKGTLVRVWDPASSALVKELRRGTDSAEIFGIAFRSDGGALCVSSDKGTVHVWDLKTSKEEKRRSADPEGAETSRQKQFKILKPYLPKYFSSEWSHSQFRLPPPAPAPSRLPFSLSNPNETGRSTPTIEDDVCICSWIEVDAEPTDGLPPSPIPAAEMKRTDSRESRKGQGKEREREAREEKDNRRNSRYSRVDPTPPPIPQPPPKESQIVALTHSGGWFRISLGAQEGRVSGGKEAPSFGLGKDSTSDCRLEEYRRFGSKDGW